MRESEIYVWTIFALAEVEWAFLHLLLCAKIVVILFFFPRAHRREKQRTVRERLKNSSAAALCVLVATLLCVRAR